MRCQKLELINLLYYGLVDGIWWKMTVLIYTKALWSILLPFFRVPWLKKDHMNQFCFWWFRIPWLYHVIYDFDEGLPIINFGLMELTAVWCTLWSFWAKINFEFSSYCSIIETSSLNHCVLSKVSHGLNRILILDQSCWLFSNESIKVKPWCFDECSKLDLSNCFTKSRAGHANSFQTRSIIITKTT